jgi:hypothetical protein
MWEVTDLDWKFSGAIGILAPAFVNSHIWPKPGQLWGTLGSVMGAASPTPRRATQAEKLLEGKPITEKPGWRALHLCPGTAMSYSFFPLRSTGRFCWLLE